MDRPGMGGVPQVPKDDRIDTSSSRLSVLMQILIFG